MTYKSKLISVGSVGPAGPPGDPTIPFAVTGGIVNRTLADRFADIVNVAEFGLIADGSSHPLGDEYSTLAEAQGVYPFVTSLEQEIDYCACKLGSNIAFGGDIQFTTSYHSLTAIGSTYVEDNSQNWIVKEHAGKTLFHKFDSNGFVQSQVIASNTATRINLVAPFIYSGGFTDDTYAIGYGEHGDLHQLNKKLWLPAGSYRFGDDTWTIRNLASGVIEGAGRLATTIRGNKTLLAFDGIWYSELANFSLLSQTSDAEAAMELDGNIPGHAYATRGVQGVTLRNLLIDGGGSNYALAMTRQGGSSGQGSECLYLNIHLQNADFACYYQNGFNALANTFIGGNFQGYTKNGIYVVGGTVAVINTGFQSTRGYRQIENDGWDINVGDSGAYEACVIEGCRTESLRFMRSGGAITARVSGVVGTGAVAGWFTNRAYGPAADAYKAIVEGTRLFVATTPGTTGAVKPDFASVEVEGTVVDGGVTWTETPFDFINIPAGMGSVDFQSIYQSAGSIHAPGRIAKARFADSDIMLDIRDDTCIVDASNGPVTISTPFRTAAQGKRYTIKKSDTSNNAVTVWAQQGGEDGSHYIIPGGSRGSITIEYERYNTIGQIQWVVIGRLQ